MEKKFVSIEGYTHIATVATKARQKMQEARSGKLRPLITRSKKETEKIGGIFPSDQVVIAGRTGTGKTAKALIDIFDYADSVLNPTYADDLLILIDSYEMVDWRLFMRAVSRKGEIEAKALLDWQQRLSQERFEMFLKVTTMFSHLPIYITNRPLPVKQWIESKKRIQGNHPTKRIINLFDHTRLGVKENEGKEEELITGYMVGGVHLKNTIDSWMIFLSQMNRNIETAISRDKLGTHLPVASDIFGSDAVMQCADLVIALHRPGLYGLETFQGIPTGYSQSDPNSEDYLFIECILKQREGWTGNILMKHNLKYNQIEDYEIPGTLPQQTRSIQVDDFT